MENLVSGRRIAGASRLTGRDLEKDVGYRLLLATRDENDLTMEQKAALRDEFAAEFETVSPLNEPYDGWGQEVAAWLRAAARVMRGGDPAAPENNPTRQARREARLRRVS
jgi:hypothetical protein